MKVLKYSFCLFVILIMLFSFNNVCFSQERLSVSEEIKGVGDQAIEAIPESFEKAESVWKTIWTKLKSWVKFIWDKIWSFLNAQVEERKPEVRQEFEREIGELTEEIKREAPSVWDRFKSLVGR